MKRRSLVPVLAGTLALGAFQACTGDDPEVVQPLCAEGTVCGPGLVCSANRCVIADAGPSSDAPASDAPQGRRPIAPAWATDLLAYWPFDGDALDYGGSQLDLDVSGVSFEPGPVGSALQRSATSLVKRPGDDAQLSLGDATFTLTFWIYLEESKSGVVMSKLPPVNETGWSLDRVGIFDGEHLNLVTYRDGGASTALGPPLFVKEWSHYAIVRSQSGSVLTYRNGAFANGDSIDVALPTSGQFRIGESVSNPARNLDGKLDEVAFWKRALTATEIAALYNEGKGQSLFAP